MKAKFIITLLIASSASLAASAFASGYGPAPFYRPDVGAPASQQGQTSQAMAAEEGRAAMNDESRNGVGGDESVRSESGGRAPVNSIDSIFRGG